MKKNLIFVMVLAILVTSFGLYNPGIASAAGATEGQVVITDVSVCVDGKLVTFTDQKPYVDANARTLVPIRFVSQEMGMQVIWENDTKRVIINKPDLTITMVIGKKTVGVNGVAKPMDTAPIITNGRTMVPIRFISENMGAVVTWAQDVKCVFIFTKGQTAEQQKQIIADITAQLLKNNTVTMVPGTPWYQASKEQIEACRKAPKVDSYNEDLNKHPDFFLDPNVTPYMKCLPFKFYTDSTLMYFCTSTAVTPVYRGYMDLNDGKGYRIMDVDMGANYIIVCNPTDKKTYYMRSMIRGVIVEGAYRVDPNNPKTVEQLVEERS